MFSRRHHCRFCLRSVSDGAAKQKLFGHRICDTCVGDGLTGAVADNSRDPYGESLLQL